MEETRFEFSKKAKRLIRKNTIKVLRIPEMGVCWEYQKGRGRKDKYCFVKFRGRQIPAHRLSYLAFKGNIPKGYQVDHLCFNRPCVRPRHLEAVTASVNIKRACVKNRKSKCPYGHPYTKENTFWDKRDGWRQCRICRNRNKKEYGERERKREKERLIKLGRYIPPPQDRTHCPQGHEYNKKNTSVDKTGRRHCKICERKRSLEWYHRNKSKTR